MAFLRKLALAVSLFESFRGLVRSILTNIIPNALLVSELEMRPGRIYGTGIATIVMNITNANIDPFALQICAFLLIMWALPNTQKFAMGSAPDIGGKK